MDNDLIYLSGGDIPFAEAQIVIHPPTIYEIAYLGEQAFYTGIEFLRFSKNSLSEEDKIRLESLTDFNILMSIMKEKNAIVQQNKVCMEMVLSLLFPDYKISLDKTIILSKDGEDSHEINEQNFEIFRSIVNKMFCLTSMGLTGEYNPAGKAAQDIAEKFRKRREKLKEQKKDGNGKIEILGRYVSILAVGEQKDLNSLMKYTVYQLFDEFQRYELKASYDLYFEAKLAGAQDLKEPKDWMKSLYEEENKDEKLVFS